MSISRIRFVRWLAPFNECFILNTDGASKGASGLAGGGGVIRDNRGIFHKAFSSNFGVCTAYKAELKAVHIGLQMARDMNITLLEIQMDNQACIEVLKKPEYHGGECYHLVNNCRQLIALSSWSVRLVHCYREGNRVADKLANIGVAQLNKIVFYNSPPVAIVSLLREDLEGVTTPRVVS